MLNILNPPTGILTYENGTHHYQFNPFEAKQIEQVFETFELCLNKLGKVPNMPRTGAIRILIGGIALSMIALVLILYKSIEIFTDAVKGNYKTKHENQLQKLHDNFTADEDDKNKNLQQRFYYYFKINRIDYLARVCLEHLDFNWLILRKTFYFSEEDFKKLSSKEKEKFKRLIAERQRYISWVFHGVGNMLRGTIESYLPWGSSALLTTLYDLSGRYEYKKVVKIEPVKKQGIFKKIFGSTATTAPAA